jgi:phage shock protein C
MFDQTANRRLYRSRTDKQMTGVSGGLGAYLGVDPTVIRILWVVATFVTFPVAPIAYVVLAAMIPQEPIASPSDTFMI